MLRDLLAAFDADLPLERVRTIPADWLRTGLDRGISPMNPPQ